MCGSRRRDRETGREGNRIEEAQWVLEKLTDRQTDTDKPIETAA